MFKRCIVVGWLASVACPVVIAQAAPAQIANHDPSTITPRTHRIFRAPRLTRGNTNIVRLQPIDEADWIWHKDDLPGASAEQTRQGDFLPVMVFENDFDVKPDEGPFEIDVSADERFYLTIDGHFVARGPNRGTVENWQYNTYKVSLAPGKHTMRAVVTRLGEHAPLAQLSYRGGFILKASGPFDERLTTGKGNWRVAWWKGLRPDGFGGGSWGCGKQFVVQGAGPYGCAPSDWQKPVTTRAKIHDYKIGDPIGGARAPGWMLFPSQLPDQTENAVRPGVFRAATRHASWRGKHVYAAAETNDALIAQFNALLREGRAFTLPPKTRVQLAWHLGRYVCAYPVLKTDKGAGARVSWCWHESAQNGSDGRKGDRAAIVGKWLDGFGDVFLCDGKPCEFSAPWFRCGLWCRIDVETGDEPLVLRDLEMIESRYPLEMESDFVSADDPSLADVRRICARAMQMCCHEMLFDCPFYEQQMYPGDTRVQLLVLAALSRDERIVKRAIEIYDLATRDDGQCPFNFPSRPHQEGFTYTQCYLLMYGDYVMNHADKQWLRARLPGLRKSMAGCELYENAQGLVENTPGWNFMDWTTEWIAKGARSSPPDTQNGYALNAFVNLLWLLDMQAAAKVERAFGNEHLALHWEAKGAKLKRRIKETFWDAKHGLIADTPAKKSYSEHCQALALLADALDDRDAATCFKHLIEDDDLARTTVYFSYYLFEAYFKMGRADLFQKRLDLWRGYVAKHLTTLSEEPDTPKKEGRSDCHAWGAHPIWFMQTGFAGIKSDAPFFAKVLVAPQPGTLKQLKAHHPHPNGWIDVKLIFDGDKATGRVATPVPGTFRYKGAEIPLHAGENEIDTSAQTPQYDVAAYVWPAYQNEPRWKELGIFAAGKGEWQSVWEARAKWPGHDQPRRPLWGFEDESDPVVVEKKIDAAVAHGVNVFIYDWYWYGHRPFLEDGLDRGFLGAKNNAKMKFFLMWANHGVVKLWDNKVADKQWSKPIWPGEVSEQEFPVLVERWIARYFSRPNYYRIDGKPVLMIYELGTFIGGVGGPAAAKRALDLLRTRCKQAGLGGVYLMACDFALDKHMLDGLGIDGATMYNFVHWFPPKTHVPYDVWTQTAQKRYDAARATLGVKDYFAHVSVGWDTNPRYPADSVQPSVTNATPVLFASALERAKRWTDAHARPGAPKLVTVNSWNEWTEGSYLEPDATFGFDYLNAVKRVFAPDALHTPVQTW